MTILRTAIVFAAVTLVSAAAPALAQAPHAARPQQTPHVYLLRGFMNVFSLGMDSLAEKLQRRGLKAEVYNHVSGSSIVSELIEKRRAGDRAPIILIGHSLGASEVISMANDLSAAGISADLVVPVDAVVTTTALGTTKKIVNFYLSNGVGAPVMAGAGFKGSLRNVDVRDSGVGHIFIDKAEKVQDQIIAQVMAAVARPAPAKPVAAATPVKPAEGPATTSSIPAAPATPTTR